MLYYRTRSIEPLKIYCKILCGGVLGRLPLPHGSILSYRSSSLVSLHLTFINVSSISSAEELKTRSNLLINKLF